MVLEYLAPGARRRRHTAGTTEASLLGLLDVGNHGFKGTEWPRPCQSIVARNCAAVLVLRFFGVFRFRDAGSTPIRGSFFSACWTSFCAVSSKPSLVCVK